jgi:GT2 family glycosyltransferase
MTPRIGIAFTIREKFGWALAGLRRLYAYAGEPFTLYLVDSVYPAEIRAELLAFLQDKPNVEVIEPGRYLYPNEALNEVIARLKEPYLCLLQNDVLVEPHFLSHMLETCEALPCDLVSPLIYEYFNGERHLHREGSAIGTMVQTGGAFQFKIQGQTNIAPAAGKKPEIIKTTRFEMHCLLMTAAAARRAAPLPRINTRDHIDLALRVWRAGCSSYLDERAEVGFVDVPPIHDYDSDFFRFRWDVPLAEQSHVYLKKAWNIANFPSVMGFVHHQNEALHPELLRRAETVTSEIDLFQNAVPAAPSAQDSAPAISR